MELAVATAVEPQGLQLRPPESDDNPPPPSYRLAEILFSSGEIPARNLSGTDDQQQDDADDRN